MHDVNTRQPRAPEKLLELASWYREFAERAGSTVIWEARLRMAEDLEAEADRLGARKAPRLGTVGRERIRTAVVRS